MYRMTDRQLVSHIEGIVDNLKVHYEAFTHFNSVKYGETFLDELEATLQKARLSIEMPTHLNDQKILSKKVKETIEQLKSSLQYIRLHVNDAFEDNPTKIAEFNLAKITVHSPNPDNFLSFAKQSLGVVALNCKKLIENGLRSEILDDAIEKLDELHDLRKKQLEMMKRKEHETSERVTLLNALWVTVKKIRDAAKYVFPNEPESEKLFTLPKNSYGNR